MRNALSYREGAIGRTVALFAAVSLMATLARPQHLSNVDREKAQAILQGVAGDVRKYYCDPKLHGVDWDARVDETKEAIAKTDSWNTAILEVAALLDLERLAHVFCPAAGSHEPGVRLAISDDRKSLLRDTCAAQN